MSSSNYCAVRGCPNQRGKVPNLSFFQFPKDVERCKDWVSFAKKEFKDIAQMQRSHYAICGGHFEESMFMSPTVRKESVLCHFHSKFTKSVTALEVDIDDFHYCVTCGAPIESTIEVSPTAYELVCKRKHAMFFTTEFSLKCHDWITECRKQDQRTKLQSPEDICYLCKKNSTYTGIKKTSFPSPAAQEVTAETTMKPRVLASESNNEIQPLTYTKEFPSLSCSFISVSPNQRSHWVQTNMDLQMKKEVALEKRLKVLVSRVSRLKNQVERLKMRPKVSFEIFCKELEKYVKGACLLLIKEQLKLSQCSADKICWSSDLLMLAKTLHKESVEAYHILGQLMKIPAESTIEMYENPSQESQNLTDYLSTTFPYSIETELLETDLPTCKEENIMAENQNKLCDNEEKMIIGMEDEMPLTIGQEQEIITETNDCGSMMKILPTNSYEIPVFEIYPEEAMVVQEELQYEQVATETLNSFSRSGDS